MKEGYKKTELGEIPFNWKIKKIGEIFDFYGGLSLSRAQLSDDGVYYLHYGDIHKKNKNHINLDRDCEWLPKANLDISNIKEGTLLDDGDIVFADASEDYEGIGKSVVIFNESNKSFISGLHTIIAKDKIKRLNKYYKKYCFNINEVKKQFRVIATGATVFGVSKSNIKEIKILIPPLEEQKKIASILSTVDDQIENTEKLIDKTKELKKGLMQTLLTKGIGHIEFKKTEVGEIPVAWEVEKISKVAEVNPRKVEVDNENIEVSFIGMSDVSDEGRIISKNTKKYSNVSKGYTGFKDNDVLLAKITPCFENGKRALANNLFNGIGFGSTEFHVLRANKKILPEYIYYYISTHRFREKAKLNMTGSAGQQRVPTDFVKDYAIPIPPLEEQKKIASILLSVDEQIENYESKKEKLEELKKGLMQQLLTGKIRVDA